MLRILDQLRSSFWFLPAMMVLAAIMLALFMIWLDTIVARDTLTAYTHIFGVGAAGSRALLSAIASSTITVTGVVFSITIVALSLSASQYSPRVLRNFMRDRANQAVLGIFVGVFVYCLIVLRTIQGGDDGFIPGLSVLMGIVLALVGVGFLIFFIHHISTSIQIATITENITKETMHAIDTLYPESLGEPAPEPVVEEQESGLWQPIPATRTGYIQAVNEEALLIFACQRNATLRLRRCIGEFIIAGRVLAEVQGNHPITAEDIEELNSLHYVNAYRSIAQDVGFGILQLTDIATRALSPGINDRSTAVTALHYLTAVLCHLAHRHMPSPYRYDGECLRVIAQVPTFEDYVQETFTPIRRNAEGDARVILALIQSLVELEDATCNDQRRKVLEVQARLVKGMIERMEGAPEDREEAQAAHGKLMEKLGRWCVG